MHSLFSVNHLPFSDISRIYEIHQYCRYHQVAIKTGLKTGAMSEKPKIFGQLKKRMLFQKPNGDQRKRPDISSGLILYPTLNVYYIISNFEICSLTCQGLHSSTSRQYSRNHLRHDNSKILLQTYHFFYFYLFWPCVHPLIIKHHIFR